MGPCWLSGQWLLQLHAVLFFSWLLCIHGFKYGLTIGSFQGNEALPLVNCTIQIESPKLQDELSLRDEKTGAYLANVSYQSQECSTGGSFASCVLGDRTVTLLAVITDLEEGEKRSYRCRVLGTDFDQTSGVEYLKTTTGSASAPPSDDQKLGTKDWIRTGSLNGVRDIRVVECRRPKDQLLSMSLYDKDTQASLGNANVLAKSCTMEKSSFASCVMDDANPDVTLKVLVTDLAEGENRTLACDATYASERKSASVVVSYEDTMGSSSSAKPAADTGGMMMVTCALVVLLWSPRQR